jgi:hypothetical protein
MQKVGYCSKVILLGILAMVAGWSVPCLAEVVAESGPVLSLDGEWLLAPDPQNSGRENQWWAGPVPDAKAARVPWIIQDAFPGYHGVAWYWRAFETPVNAHPNGRHILRFWAVDYLAEVWVNGVAVGGHEGGESPFELDVTDAVNPQGQNMLAVRVLNPTEEPIDGIVLKETPHRNKVVSYWAGASFDQGGIMDSVELLAVPAVRIEDLFVRANAASGVVRAEINLRNATEKTAPVIVDFTIAPAREGTSLSRLQQRVESAPGDTLAGIELKVENPHCWDLNDPYLYRVTVRMTLDNPSGSSEERSARCGFRDFRFERGYFRLNGRRIFLRSSHTGNHCPLGLQLPHDPDLIRRDLLNVKVMGFNAIRFIAGVGARYQLDLCDEIGLLVYEEPYAAWCLEDSPHMAKRFDESLLGMVRRDRNHPSIVVWGLLNETPDGPVFRHAASMLPSLRALDDTRMVLLNSGRWDNAADSTLGSLSNPGSAVWENVLNDQHCYPRVPHSGAIIRSLREYRGGGHGAGMGEEGYPPETSTAPSGLPVFLSEYGIGSAVDLVKTTRHYEQLGAEYLEDAQFYQTQLDRFMEDWQRWNMADTFGRPEDYFTQCLAKMAGQRLLGFNAIRSNPHFVGFSLTGTVDQGMTGEGLTTTFREFKPGTIDAVHDGWAPLRWCMFAEPVNTYTGNTVRLEAVLANEDALKPGEYPVRVMVLGPDARKVFEKELTIAIGSGTQGTEPPLALPVFAEDVPIDGPSGAYRWVAAFERGGAAAGGEATFYITHPADPPAENGEVVLWGDDAELSAWLTARGYAVRPFDPANTAGKQTLLVSRTPAVHAGEPAFVDLWKCVAGGSTAVCLSPEIFQKGDDRAGWLPWETRGTLKNINGWLYLKDEWAKHHPVFTGLPCGGLMDYTYYRELIPDTVWSGQEALLDAVAGANKTSQGYDSGLLLSVHGYGQGRIILNTLRIREHLGEHPAADRLLVNLLAYSAGSMQP